MRGKIILQAFNSNGGRPEQVKREILRLAASESLKEPKPLCYQLSFRTHLT